MRILVLDDEPAVCDVVADILRSRGFDVAVACQGEEAVVTLERGDRFDLAVVDVVMPRIAGDEFARRLRTYDRDAKVLFLTGYPGALFQARPTLWDGEAFLEKPFSEKGLVEAVSLLLYGRIGQSA